MRGRVVLHVDGFTTTHCRLQIDQFPILRVGTINLFVPDISNRAVDRLWVIATLNMVLIPEFDLDSQIYSDLTYRIPQILKLELRISPAIHYYDSMAAAHYHFIHREVLEMAAIRYLNEIAGVVGVPQRLTQQWNKSQSR